MYGYSKFCRWEEKVGLTPRKKKDRFGLYVVIMSLSLVSAGVYNQMMLPPDYKMIVSQES